MSSNNTDIAIIGYSCTLPGGENIHESWDMILEELDNISDLPENRLDVTAYYDPVKTTKDKIYCKRGGFINDYQNQAIKSNNFYELLELNPEFKNFLDSIHRDGHKYKYLATLSANIIPRNEIKKYEEKVVLHRYAHSLDSKEFFFSEDYYLIRNGIVYAIQEFGGKNPLYPTGDKLMDSERCIDIGIYDVEKHRSGDYKKNFGCVDFKIIKPLLKNK